MLTPREVLKEVLHLSESPQYAGKGLLDLTEYLLGKYYGKTLPAKATDEDEQAADYYSAAMESALDALNCLARFEEAARDFNRGADSIAETVKNLRDLTHMEIGRLTVALRE